MLRAMGARAIKKSTNHRKRIDKRAYAANLFGAKNANRAEPAKVHNQMIAMLLILISSIITMTNYLILPASAGCQRSKGMARISNKNTGKTLRSLNKVEVFECGNSWGSNGGYEFTGEMVQWVICKENCTNLSDRGGYTIFFKKKNQGIGVVETFAGVTCMWQIDKIEKYCWKPLKSHN